MGFFSAMRLSSLYDKRIRAHGFEPRSLPPDLHSTICSSFERRAERFADMSQLVSGARSDFIEASIEAAADLLVLCCVGPESYGRGFGVATTDVIADLARTWISDGPEGSIELHLMQAVNQTGNLNPEFVRAFKVERARQEQEILAQKRAEEAKNSGIYAEHAARLASIRAQVAAERPASIAIVLKASAKRARAGLND